VLTLFSNAKSVLEKVISDFQGIIKELGQEKCRKVRKTLPLFWTSYCRFLASDYIFWLSVKGI
jgi:hypothetical protein